MNQATEKDIFFRKTFWILLVLFLVSVIIRLPNINRPLSKHHEFCTALTLIILQSWTDGGIKSYQYNPPTTFPLPANHFINNCSMDTMQQNGNFFYLSHPPLAYYLPFVLFKVLDLYPNVLGLQIFNLTFEFLTIIFIYLITSLLVRIDSRKTICWTGIIAANLYIFLPVTIWFHSNVYMADMFVQNIWAPALFITLKIFIERREKSFRWLTWFCIALFLMIYTDWLGVFFAASIVSAALHRVWRKHEKSFYLIAIFSGVIAIATVSIVLMQYSSVAGWQVLKYCFIYRYEERGTLGWSGLSDFISSVEALAFNYGASYLPLVPAIAIFFVKRKYIVANFKNCNLFVWLSLATVLIDHLVFLKYATQDFAVLKASFFLSVLSAISISRIAETKSHLKIMTTVLISAIGIGLYYYINRPGKISLSGDRYAFEKETGDFMRGHADSSEVIFAKGFDITPQIVFYAHRNIKKIKNKEQAIIFMRQHAQSHGVIFSMSSRELEYQKIEQ